MKNKKHSVSVAPSYVVNRSRKNNSYSIWQLELGKPELFTQLNTNPAASFPGSAHLIAIGGYLISYDVSSQTSSNGQPEIGYRMFSFDPANPDPLNVAAVQQGAWDQNKFGGFYDHYEWPPYTLPDILQLVPMTGYVLAYMPTSTRATYRLWNFDPAPTTPGSDPLSNAITPQDAFSLIGENSQLLPIGNYVLEWIAPDSFYRVWSFDPQSMTPLQLPVISCGHWPKIDASHRLQVIDEYLLDWVPTTGAYTLWRFDPKLKNPLAGKVQSGKLPAAFTASTQLTPVQPLQPVNAASTATPGTMDFMRDKIEHVVVYMLESRSMDSVLGWLYDKKSTGLNYINAAPPFKGTSTQYSNKANGKTYHVYQYQGGKLSTNYDLNAPTLDPFHGVSDSIRQQYSSGYQGYFSHATPDMGGFVSNNASKDVMVTFSAEQLPVLNGLAKSFAVSDEWFSPMPGGTDSNRAIALTGSAFNITTTYEGNPQYDNFPGSAHRQSIWKVLWNNGIKDWKIYWSIQWYNHVFTYHLYLKGDIPSVDANVAANKTDYVAPIQQFYNDAAAGTLPRFSFLEPFWIAPKGATSYHPGGDLVPGEVELNKIYQAIADGPGWEKTALVITFSKGGGLYDHVPPPSTVNPWPHDVNDGFAYDVLGPRVPAIVVSPWVNQNTVFRSPGETAFSATSILATVLKWFGIPKARWGLGDRVQVAETFEQVFQRSTPRTDKPAFSNPYDKTYPPSK